MGSGVSRYSPRSLVTSVTCGTCSAGLVAVTVTPGRIAPLSSLTCPMMLASCCASATSQSPSSEKMKNAETTRDLRDCAIVLLIHQPPCGNGNGNVTDGSRLPD